MPADHPQSDGLLSGLRVVEVALLAPSALGGHLAELGADVIKVESGVGDYVRDIRRRARPWTSDMHELWNRGKRSVAIDLDADAGQQSFRHLVANAELVIEGRRPGYLERRGLGFKDLLKVNRSLVFTCFSGFGDSGPYREYPSHGPAFDAFAGLAPPTTDAAGRPRIPASQYLPAGLLAGPLHAAMATLAAVLHARSTGRPVYLDIAQADAAVYATALDLARWLDVRPVDAGGDAGEATAEKSEPPADLFEGSVLVQYYRTSDNLYILLQALERKFFERFCQAIGRPDLVGEFPPSQEVDWLYGNDDLRAKLADVFARKPAGYWLDLCHRHGVPCTPVNSGEEILHDPHFQHRARWVAGEGDERGVLGLPVLADPPLPNIRRAPRLGEHTIDVLGDAASGETPLLDALQQST